MGAYIFRRILQSLVVILGVIIITFLISRVLGDPVALLLPPEATPEQRAYLTRDLGLDRPLYIQLVVYVGKVARGDFGLSFRHQEPAMKLLLGPDPGKPLPLPHCHSYLGLHCFTPRDHFSHQEGNDL